jgi:hypothetical protein
LATVGITSEQPGEAVRADFKKSWSKLKVKKVDNPRWVQNLLKTVLDFNALSSKELPVELLFVWCWGEGGGGKLRLTRVSFLFGEEEKNTNVGAISFHHQNNAE